MNDILALLESKRELLCSFEALSLALLQSDITALEGIVDEREQVIDQMKEINDSIDQISRGLSYDAITQAIANKDNREDVEDALLPLFDKSQEVYTVLNRIVGLESLVSKYLEERQMEVEQKIKEMNVLPKINRYLDTLSSDLEDGSLISSRANKV